MKKLMVFIATTVMLLTCPLIQSKAETNPVPVSASYKGAMTEKEIEAAKVEALIKRIHEINAMDRSTMTWAERKEIRKELREIKKEVKRHGGGGAVYISGSLLVVILILIILF
jgi:hypothetical protein